MTDAMTITLHIRLDRVVSDKALADELALHSSPLIVRHICCGDVVLDNGAEGDWALTVTML